MSRRKKIALGTLAVLALIGVAIGALLLNLNSVVEKLRPTLLETARRSLGQRVDVAKLGVSLFPSPKIVLTDVSVVGEPTAEPLDPVRVGTIELQSSIGALLKGEVDIRRLTLKDADLPVRRDAGGAFSLGPISFKKNDVRSAGDSNPERPAASRSPKPERAQAVQVEQLEIRNARLRFSDEMRLPSRKLLLEGITGDVSLRSEENGARKISADFDLTNTHVEAREGEAIVAEKKASIPCKISGAGTLSGDSSFISDEIRVQLGESRFSGRYSAPKNRAVEVNLTNALLRLTDIAALFPQVGLFGPQGTLRSDKLVASLGSETKSVVVDGTVALEGVSARWATGTATNPPREPLILSGAQGNLVFSGRSISTQGLAATVNDEPITLDVKVPELANPAIEFTVRSPNLRVASLLKTFAPQSAASDLQLSNAEIKGSYSVKDKRGDLLASINKLTSEKFFGPQHSLTDARIQVLSSPTKIEFSSVNSRLFGGELQGRGAVSTSDKKFSVSALTKGINLQAVGTSTGKKFLSGTLASGEANLTGDTSRLPASLSGPLNATVTKGSIPGLNIVGEALKGVSAIPGVSENLSKYLSPEAQRTLSGSETDFDQLTVNAFLGEGGVEFRQFDLEHSLYIIAGSGRLGFDGDVRMKSQLRLTPALTRGMVARQKKLKLLLDPRENLTFPVMIRKEGGRILVLPDVSELVKNVATSGVRDAAERALEKAVPGVGKVKDVLDSLFR